jgi:hypothetical protein
MEKQAQPAFAVSTVHIARGSVYFQKSRNPYFGRIYASEPSSAACNVKDDQTTAAARLAIATGCSMYTIISSGE